MCRFGPKSENGERVFSLSGEAEIRFSGRIVQALLDRAKRVGLEAMFRMYEFRMVHVSSMS